MSDGKHIIEWGHDYLGRPMITCNVGQGVTVGVKGEHGVFYPVNGILCERSEYYVAKQKDNELLSWCTAGNPLAALALFYSMIREAQMKGAQP